MPLGMKVRKSHYVIPAKAPGAPASDDTVSINDSLVSLLTYSKEVLPDRERRYLEIQNVSASAIYVNIGSQADVRAGFTIAPGGAWSPQKAPRGSIHMKGTYTGQQIIVMEGV